LVVLALLPTDNSFNPFTLLIVLSPCLRLRPVMPNLFGNKD